MSSPPSPNDNTAAEKLSEAKGLISRAVSIGAPAYNSGDIARCAKVYEETAQQIVPLLPASSSLRTQLEAATANGLSSDDDNAKAWAYRKQFDAILEYQPPLTPLSQTSAGTTLEPFTPQQLPSPPLEVMDSVMGGISRGTWNPSTTTFSGRTALDFNGGFSSLRWRFPVTQNWSYAKGLYLRVTHSRPAEHTFRLVVKDVKCERIRLANYKAVFANPDGDGVIFVPFGVFGEMDQMGSRMAGSPAFDPSSVTEIGIMAIKPTVVGDFELRLHEWGLYS